MERLQVFNLYNDGWQGLIVKEAFSHPAKAAKGLAYWIVREGLRRGWWSRESYVTVDEDILAVIRDELDKGRYRRIE